MHYDESHFLQTTAIVAIRILPNMTEAYFLVQKSVSLIFMKRFLLYLILWAVFDIKLFYLICLWWFDNLHCRVLQCSHGKPSRTLWEGLLHTLLFFRVLYSIPRACQMDSLSSVRILSPPSYFLEADKTGRSASTSDWPESCFSKLQCRRCLALTSNELDIYTFHTDKSKPIHMEGLYTYRINTICTIWALQSETHQLGNFSFLTPKE